MNKNIKNLADALAHIEAQDAEIKTANDLLAAEKTAHESTKGDLKAANDLLTEAQTESATVASALEAEQKAHLATAAERDDLKTEVEATAKLHADMGIKADADAKTNSEALTGHAKRLASAEAMQICAAQGVDIPVPDGVAAQPGESKPAAKKTPAQIFQAQVDRLRAN
jgi:chromosome segregation ATPase